MVTINKAITIREGTNQLIEIFKQWDAEKFNTKRTISVESGEYQLQLKMDKRPETRQKLQALGFDFLPNTTFFIDDNPRKALFYANFSLRKITPINSFDEADEFSSLIFEAKLLASIFILNVQLSNVRIPKCTLHNAQLEGTIPDGTDREIIFMENCDLTVKKDLRINRLLIGDAHNLAEGYFITPSEFDRIKTAQMRKPLRLPSKQFLFI